MFSQLPTKERIAYAAIASLAIAGIAYMGFSNRHSSAVVFENLAAESQQTAPKEVVVHVAGAVRNPGVYHLGNNARIDDALKAAGGANEGADLDSLNLAAKVEDGAQIYVQGTSAIAGAIPVKVEGVPRAAPQHPSRKASNTAKKKATPSQGSISLNSAHAAQLESLPGIGKVTAQKIIDYRAEHGRFSSIDELLAVKGIGPKKLEAIRPFVRL